MVRLGILSNFSYQILLSPEITLLGLEIVLLDVL